MPTWSLATVERNGSAVACVEVDHRLYDLGAALARDGARNTNGLLSLFDDWETSLAALDQIAKNLIPADEIVEYERRLAPLLYPGKILCAGGNYYDHMREMGVQDVRKENQRAFFFFKPPRNAVVSEGDTVRVPIGTDSFDWEVELAAVIGRRARAVSVESALDHVAAYTVAVDFSARDLNMAPDAPFKFDWVAGKAHDTCCPMGPRLVPAADFGDPQDVGLRLSVNRKIKQNGRSTDMIFTVAEQIATASQIMTLDPGDVLLTGTPAGVGRPTEDFLSVGDQVDAEIERIGRLSVIIGEAA